MAESKRYEKYIQVLFHPGHEYCAGIVSAAMIRSFTSSQVRVATYEECGVDAVASVLISPGDMDRTLWSRLTGKGRKVMVLGNLGTKLADEMGLCVSVLPPNAREWSQVIPDAAKAFDMSPMAVRYERNAPLTDRLALRERYLCRYDFGDEWNNHGYGRIESAGGPWSLCQSISLSGARMIAGVVDRAGLLQIAYATLTDLGQAAILWFNRETGPVDSLEWTVVEEFFSGYRHEELCCFPCLDELPGGVAAVVSPRLDCDQAVGSVRKLVEMYTDYQIPLSLAVLTGLPLSTADEKLLRQVVYKGGALLSHSCRHLPDWGGNHELAVDELHASAAWLERYFPGRGFSRIAVSPFHQNPLFAVEAMVDAGYEGFVGGIIHNDPEFLLGRAGQVPCIPGLLVSISQQCMLHGDCFHRYGNVVQPYMESFQQYRAAGAFFGYLDHPFSSEYQYGWMDEAERLGAHEALIRLIRRQEGIEWWNLRQCFDFLLQRAQIGVEWIGPGEWKQAGACDLNQFSWRWKG